MQQELIQMKLDEQSVIKEIRQLEEDLNELKYMGKDHQKLFQNELNTLNNINIILKKKEEEFSKVNINWEDENEIKHVLRLRVKDLEKKLEEKENEANLVIERVENSKGNQKVLKGKLEMCEFRLKEHDEKSSMIEEIRKRTVEEILKKETKYKDELMKEAQEKTDLSDELKKLAYRVKAMQECLSDKNDQIENIDQKISELIKIRKKMGRNQQPGIRC